MIQITADTRRAVVTNKELLTTGSAGIQVQFTLSEDWAGLAKVAVFRQGDEGEKVDCVLDSGLTCVVPHEVLTTADEVVFCGIYGSNGQGTIIIPTIWASLGVVRPGTEPNTPATATPTLEIWAQILNVAQDAEATADEAMSLVETGLNDLAVLEAMVETAEASRVSAEQSRVTAENQRVVTENSRVSAENTRDANENARDSAETARTTAEQSRAAAENARASAESARVSAEQERVAAEQYREEKYAEYVETVSEYADNARTFATAAAGSASAAATAASAAAASAGQAASSATAAGTSASQAADSATSATQSATSAQEQASAAAGSATAAASSASAAATSAQNASTSASNAVSSATVAQTAQSAAEDAQDAAETAAASVSASAAQIAQNTSDISDLNRQISDLENVTIGDLADLITEDKSSIVAAINEAAISGGQGLTIILQREDGVTVTGVTVTVTKGTGTEATSESYAYTGQPLTVGFVVDTAYRISVSGTITGFITPPDAFGMYLAPQLIILTYATAKRYGYKREKAESNCADRITYLFDAVGMTPAGMTYNSSHVGTFDYGSWESFINQVARPVMLNPDGTIKYELDHDNQLYRIDGSPSEVELTAQDANAMTEFGSAFKWVKRYEDEDYEYVIFSNTQYDSDYHAYAHTGDDGNVKEAFYIGMWEGPVVSNKLRSIADGSAVSNTITMEVAITRAKANGTGHNIVPKSRWDYVADLLTLISKTDNSQVAFGNGRQAMGSSANNRGATSELRSVGPFYGNNDNTHPVKVFWLVHWWGNVWQWLAGLVNYEGDLKYRNYGPYCDTPVSDPDYSTYASTGLDAPQEGGGFQSETHMGDYGYLWTKTEGSASTYVPDRGNANNEQVSLPVVGATWYTDAGMAGSRALNVADLASTSTARSGARLSYIPD